MNNAFTWTIFDGGMYISSFYGTFSFAEKQLRYFEKLYGKKLQLSHF